VAGRVRVNSAPTLYKDNWPFRVSPSIRRTWIGGRGQDATVSAQKEN
jgi:hypothetical protein